MQGINQNTHMFCEQKAEIPTALVILQKIFLTDLHCCKKCQHGQ